MVGLVKLVGIVIVVFGVAYAVKPANIKKVLHFWSKSNRIFIAGIINILLGIIFLRASSFCLMPWFIAIIGVLSLAKGVIVFVMGRKKFLAWAEEISKAKPKMIRILGGVTIAIGVCIIYAA